VKYFTKRVARDERGGFTLIELLVAITILILITAAMLTSHSSFSGKILLSNFAYEVALSVRQAQVFGLSVREFQTSSNLFTIGYGVHFDALDLTTYRLFADEDSNEIYNSSSDGTVETFSTRRGFQIARFCATASSGTEFCSDTGELTALDIVFLRPDPDAIINATRSNGAPGVYQRARIVLRSPQGDERSVLVEATGQISVPTVSGL